MRPPSEAETEADADGDDERGPLRRCIASGVSQPPEGMIRFVVGPDDTLVPDLDGGLPGRGLWLSARRDMIETATARRLFNKAARRAVSVPPDLADTVERLLRRRSLDLLGFARRAGVAVAGAEKVRARLAERKVALLLEAADGSPAERDKLLALARHCGVGDAGVPVMTVFTAAEMGRVLGRDLAVHVAIGPGPLADRLMNEVRRLAGFVAGGETADPA